MMADDTAGHAHARETQDAARKAEIVERFIQAGADVKGNAIAVDLFRALVMREEPPETIRKLLIELL